MKQSENLTKIMSKVIFLISDQLLVEQQKVVVVTGVGGGQLLMLVRQADSSFINRKIIFIIEL